jgi:hypothetical protein
MNIRNYSKEFILIIINLLKDTILLYYVTVIAQVGLLALNRTFFFSVIGVAIALQIFGLILLLTRSANLTEWKAGLILIIVAGFLTTPSGCIGAIGAWTLWNRIIKNIPEKNLHPIRAAILVVLFTLSGVLLQIYLKNYKQQPQNNETVQLIQNIRSHLPATNTYTDAEIDKMRLEVVACHNSETNARSFTDEIFINCFLKQTENKYTREQYFQFVNALMAVVSKMTPTPKH